MNEYELQRERNIARNQAQLLQLGLENKTAQAPSRPAAAATRPKKRPPPPPPQEPVRKSLRTLGQAAPNYKELALSDGTRYERRASGARAKWGDPAGSSDEVAVTGEAVPAPRPQAARADPSSDSSRGAHGLTAISPCLQ